MSAQRAARNARGGVHAADDDAMARGCVDANVDVSTENATATDDARARAVVDAAVRGGSATAVRARRGRRRAL